MADSQGFEPQLFWFCFAFIKVPSTHSIHSSRFSAMWATKCLALEAKIRRVLTLIWVNAIFKRTISLYAFSSFSANCSSSFGVQSLLFRISISKVILTHLFF